jgi:threonine/homoserine/homoserine lactone efflux protein
MTEFWIFLTGSLLLLVLPGPTNALLAVGGSQRGFLGSLPLLAGEVAGYGLAIAVIHLTLQPALQQMPDLNTLIKVLFSAFVLFLAFRLWRSTGTEASHPTFIGFRALFVTTLLNPKAFGFALVILPFDSPSLVFYLAALIVLMLVSGAIWIAMGAWVTAPGGPVSRMFLTKSAAVLMSFFAIAMLAAVARSLIV